MVKPHLLQQHVINWRYSTIRLILITGPAESHMWTLVTLPLQYTATVTVGREGAHTKGSYMKQRMQRYVNLLENIVCVLFLGLSQLLQKQRRKHKPLQCFIADFSKWIKFNWIPIGLNKCSGKGAICSYISPFTTPPAPFPLSIREKKSEMIRND